MKKIISLLIILSCLILSASANVDDSYTTSLLHYEGINGSTTFTDENPLNIWDAHNGAYIYGENDPFWGNNSIFDGIDDFIDTQENTGETFNLSTNNWTWDTRISFAENDSEYSHGIWSMGQYAIGKRSAILLIKKGSYGYPFLYITFYNSDVTYGQWRYQLLPGEYDENNFHHLQISRCGNISLYTEPYGWAEYVNMFLFIDGVKRDWLPVASPPWYTSFGNMLNMTLGRNDAAHVPNIWFQGKLDETRFSNGICRNTESFTPEIEPYPSMPSLPTPTITVPPPSETRKEPKGDAVDEDYIFYILLFVAGVLGFVYFYQNR